MKPNKSNKKIIRGLEYLDDDVISGVLGKIKPKNTGINNRLARRSAWVGAAVTIAACAVLLALSIPTMTTTEKNFDFFHIGDVYGSGAHTETPTEYKESSGLVYALNDDGKSAAFVSYGTCTDETVYIASTYEGLPVTVMYNNDYPKGIFPVYHENKNKNVKHIVIPDSVKYVDEKCISMCPNIESVYYGASIENISSFNFNPGYGVEFSTVEVSPENPYYSCKNNCVIDLRTNALVLATHKAVIPDDGSVKIIGRRAFAPACYWLGSIVIPEGVTVIDYGAFSGCSRLESVVFPDSLEIIDENVFSNCQNLKKVEFGANLKALNKDVLIGNHIKEIDYKGTVEQWQEIIIFGASVTYEIIDGDPYVVFGSNLVPLKCIEVHCSDGVLDSIAAGKICEYEWRNLPEYAKYVKQWVNSSTHFAIGSDGRLTKAKSWPYDEQE